MNELWNVVLSITPFPFFQVLSTDTETAQHLYVYLRGVEVRFCPDLQNQQKHNTVAEIRCSVLA